MPYPEGQYPLDDTEGTYSIVAILWVPPRMLTRNRLTPLLALTGEISMRVVFDEDRDEISVGIGIPHVVFTAVSDSELAEVVNLLRGLEDAVYHPRLLVILQRSLNQGRSMERHHQLRR